MPVWRFIYFHITHLFIDGRDSSFQLSVAFHVETSHLICSAKQMAGFCMKSRTRLKWLCSRAQIDIITNSNNYILVPYNGERDCELLCWNVGRLIRFKRPTLFHFVFCRFRVFYVFPLSSGATSNIFHQNATKNCCAAIWWKYCKWPTHEIAEKIAEKLNSAAKKCWDISAAISN